MKSIAIMVQGTTSDAGKSVLVAGLCRWFARHGYSVAPFKPQNMALNSAVTACGGEIGRAQAVQAQAAGIEATTDMNPVLLKPTTDRKAQVIVHGKALDNIDAVKYQGHKKRLMPFVFESFKRLQQQYQVVVIEGAGSPAEINLRDNDIANMGFAEQADCPVIIVADIDRGGVFAHLVGTLDLVSASEQQRTLGFVINKFRGDIGLLEPGLDWLENRTQKKVYGVLPYIHGLHIEAEDAIKSENVQGETELTVVVPVIPRISNHTDFDALRLHPKVNLCFVGPNEQHPPADLIILPGSKSVISDWLWMRDQGWHHTLYKHLRYGGKVMGICGGYQMLGSKIFDPDGVESTIAETDALNLLPIVTTLENDKTLTRVQGELFFADSERPTAHATGYEIHAGISQVDAGEKQCLPLIKSSDGQAHGLMSACGQILGSYWHGIFDHPEALQALLQWAGLNEMENFDYLAAREAAFDELCDVLSEAMDIEKLLADIQGFYQSRG
ncbi:MAG: cobyric acid synthase CobQ [Gammaproteobacteria bacterium]|nr:MAG: cobyric acid synthase CobQ [Gammaproteobacteria bacterium]